MRAIAAMFLCAALVGCATERVAVHDSQWCGQGVLQHSASCTVASGPLQHAVEFNEQSPLANDYGRVEYLIGECEADPQCAGRLP